MFVVLSDDMLKKQHKPAPNTFSRNTTDTKKNSGHKSKASGAGTSKTPETRTNKRGASSSPQDSGPSAKK